MKTLFIAFTLFLLLTCKENPTNNNIYNIIEKISGTWYNEYNYPVNIDLKIIEDSLIYNDYGTFLFKMLKDTLKLYREHYSPYFGDMYHFKSYWMLILINPKKLCWKTREELNGGAYDFNGEIIYHR